MRCWAPSYEIRLALAAARNAGGTTASAALEAALSEVMAALDDLRDLAHGIFPSILDNAGLSPALETLAERSPVPLSVVAPPAERFGPAAEMAVYLLVREGMVAAARAGADEVVARFDRAPGGLVLEVRAEPDGGTVGLSAEDLWRVGDRVAAAGGNLTYEGGVVRAVIPCA
jgi:signal transduction histidine kinase